MIKLNDKILEMVSGGWNVRTLNYDAVMEIRRSGYVVLCENNDGEVGMEGKLPMTSRNLVGGEIKIINGVPCVRYSVKLRDTLIPGGKIGDKQVEIVDFRCGYYF